MGKSKGKKKPLVDEDINDTDIEHMDMETVTDSEEEYTEAERKLLEKVRKGRTPENFDSDDEVYGLQDETENEEDDLQDSVESDIEELQEDNDIPDDRAWGRKTKNFYSSDYRYTDYSSATQKDFANAEMEQHEAKKLHTRSADEIFDIIDDRFVQLTKDNKDQEDNRQTLEFNKSSKKHQEMLAQKESRAFTVLVMDFKERMTEVKEILTPFLKLVEDGTCLDCDAVTFIKTKYHLILNYCINITFYLMLKAKGLSTQSHPVIKRLEQYRQLLSQLQSGEGNLLKEVATIVNAAKEGKPLYSVSDGSQRPIKKKTLKSDSFSKILIRQKEMMMREELLDNTDISEEFIDENNFDTEKNYDDKDKGDEEDKAMTIEEEKRAITYQMAKNRGLTPYRKKELRNPRVKHRNKYRKAKIRRRGAVKEVRKELTRYAGEISGIKAGVKKSIKLK
ncbi:something about silencing protein 10 [Odontomachus brunneus]|uniref:something about silencing protein 10 n=1 Tax=Odontomachus brunneus TaxID=486640 RepID=UPI0013F2805E|nr:something about silencing protein 10 [Odontomachus brunneus]XP_032673118.1 something about silencing protein 10 [Odontomachus brunneus]